MFTPAGGDSVLAQKFSAARIEPNARFPFTPANVGDSRTITVAARANSRLTAGAVSIRNALASSEKLLYPSSLNGALTVRRCAAGNEKPCQPFDAVKR